MKHTKEPWDWQKFGRNWCLTGQWGMRPIILSCNTHGPEAKRGLTVLENGLLVPFRPDHPDMQRIVDCVNALAGYENPAAVRECIEALTDSLEFIQTSGLNGAAQTVARAKAALALNQTEKEK